MSHEMEVPSMGKAQKRKAERRAQASREALHVDIWRYYGEERAVEGLPPVIDCGTDTQEHRERAYAIYRQPWENEDDLRALNDNLAPHWLSGMHDDELHGAILAELTEHIRALRPRRVLDAGCGVGLDLAFLAVRFPDTTFVGTDLAPEMIRRARARCARRGLRDRISFTVAAHRELPNRLPGATFDLAYMHGSCIYFDMEHLIANISGLNAVLADGAYWISEMPMEVHPHRFLHEVDLATPELVVESNPPHARTLCLNGIECCWYMVFRKRAARRGA